METGPDGGGRRRTARWGGGASARRRGSLPRRRRISAPPRRGSGAPQAQWRLAIGAAAAAAWRVARRGWGLPPNPSPSRPLGHWLLGRPERPDKPRRPARQPCPPGPKAAVGRNRDCLGPPPNSIYYFQYLQFSKDLNSSICTSNNLNSANSPQVLIRSIMYYIYLM